MNILQKFKIFFSSKDKINLLIDYLNLGIKRSYSQNAEDLILSNFIKKKKLILCWYMSKWSY